MVFKISNISRDVRVAIDENKTSERLIYEDDIDTLSFNEIVHSKIVEAVRRVVMKAPIHLLDGGIPFGDAIFWRDNGAGWILLPDDFLRLIVFKMNDWERAVYEPITSSSPIYRLQSSRYKGIRGNPQKPVVAIVRRAEGLALELYSSKDNGALVEQALYYPMPRTDRDGGIEIPPRCYKAVIYEVASLVLAVIGQIEQSAIMLEQGNQLLI